MSLPIPVPGQESGPAYANDVNNSLTLIDGHDHSAGSGVQITPNGLDINSDLSFGSNNLTLARSVRFSPQTTALSTATDLGCLYEVGDDLYYNDGLGNQIRITQSGGVVGTPGSISNLTSPASASYVSGDETFVWQSAANTPANMDGGSYIFRNITASSNGITMSAPSALSSNYTLTLPALPPVQSIMTLDNAGNIAAPYTIDNSTLTIISNIIQIKDQGVVTAKIADQAVTNIKVAANAISTTQLVDAAVTGQKRDVSTYIASGGINYSVSTDGSFHTVTGSIVTLVTTGHPTVIILQPFAGNPTADSFIATTGSVSIRVLRDSTYIGQWIIPQGTWSPSFITAFDNPGGAGSHVYSLVVTPPAGAAIVINNCQLVVIEQA